MLLKKSFLLLVCFLFTVPLFANENNQFQIKLQKAKYQIKIDGELNENEWNNVLKISDFWLHFPVDNEKSKEQTNVKICYDNNYIYFAIEMQIPQNYKPIVQSLKYDANESYWNSDAISIILDPLNKKTTGYFFGINAGGATLDGLLSSGGRTNLDANWNTKWLAKTKVYSDKWTAEIAIPLKSIEFQKENKSWGINFLRNDMSDNSYSTWTQFPVNFQGIDLAYSGELVFDSLPEPNSGKIIALPYISAGKSVSTEDGNASSVNAGADFRIGMGSSLSLDMTFNPDFSQVEVDKQVTNLSRFSISFPEKRKFFLENSDIFSFGTRSIKPFYSRTIGYNDGDIVPIIYGAKLTGNINDNTRIGFMNVQTGNKADYTAENYTIAAVQKTLYKRSYIRFFSINKQYTTNNDSLAQLYNRFVGSEIKYFSDNGKWQGAVHYHLSYTESTNTNNQLITLGINYNGRKASGSLWYNGLGDNYIAEAGRTTRMYNYDALSDETYRSGYQQFFMRAGYRMDSKLKRINFHQIRTMNVVYLNNNLSFNERNSSIEYELNFSNKSKFKLSAKNNAVQLPYSSYIISSDVPLPANFYEYTSANMAFNSNPRNKFFYAASIENGAFYNGTKISYKFAANYRIKAWGNIGIDYSEHHIQLKAPYGSAKIQLIGPKTEIAFRQNIFWTNFIQLNTQDDNLSINSRFQWRFKPMSDLYIVFTNNYIASSFTTNDWALIFKMSYWINF